MERAPAKVMEAMLPMGKLDLKRFAAPRKTPDSATTSKQKE